MNILILMGSPRLNGNTAELCKPFINEIKQNGGKVSYVTLSDKKINGCKACYACQQVTGEYGCPQQDDMQSIVNEIVRADCIVFATPIYSWFCPTEMKAVLDRHYGLNKFYGKGTGSLWAGKKIAIIATHGYDRVYGTEPFEIGINRLCEHSNLNYVGMYSVRDEDDLASYQTKESIDGAKKFARKIMNNEEKER